MARVKIKAARVVSATIYIMKMRTAHPAVYASFIKALIKKNINSRFFNLSGRLIIIANLYACCGDVS